MTVLYACTVFQSSNYIVRSQIMQSCDSFERVLTSKFAFFVLLDMKQGMMDVGIFCKEARIGINSEKGKVTMLYVLYTVHRLVSNYRLHHSQFYVFVFFF